MSRDVESYELIGMQAVISGDKGSRIVRATGAWYVEGGRFWIMGDDGRRYRVRLRREWLAISRWIGEPAHGQVEIHRELELVA